MTDMDYFSSIIRTEIRQQYNTVNPNYSLEPNGLIPMAGCGPACPRQGCRDME